MDLDKVMDRPESLLKTAVKDPVVRLAALVGAAMGGVLVAALFLIIERPREIAETPPQTVAQPAIDQAAPAQPETGPQAPVTRLEKLAGAPVKTTVIPPPAAAAVPQASARPLHGADDQIADIGADRTAPAPPDAGGYAPLSVPSTANGPTPLSTETASVPILASPKPQVPPNAPSAGESAKGPPRIAIVIDDMGVDRRRTARALKLPGRVTFSFLPYAKDIQAQADQARAEGHDVMLHVAMEPESAEIDPGPNVLLTGLPDDELRASLDWNLRQMTGYAGVNNHMGSRFTRDLASMRVVMAELRARGLFFLDSLTSRDSVGSRTAREAGVPVVRRDVFIDHRDDPDFVAAQLAKVARLAKKSGLAVAIGHPRDHTLAALEAWLPEMQAAGFVLIGVSEAVRPNAPLRGHVPTASVEPSG